VEDAKAKASEIASLAGVTLGALQNINVYSSGGPMPVYEAKGGMAASASVPIAAGQLVIQADANLSYEIK
ncbi:MAG: SIMPL domain-containing protein, partial [Bellilinea sp.]